MRSLNGMWGNTQFKFHGKYLGMKGNGGDTPPANYWYAPSGLNKPNITVNENSDTEYVWPITKYTGRRIELESIVGDKSGLFVYDTEIKYTPLKSDVSKYFISKTGVVFNNPSWYLTMNIQMAIDLKQYLEAQEEETGEDKGSTEYIYFSEQYLGNFKTEFGIEPSNRYFYDGAGDDWITSDTAIYEITDMNKFARLGFKRYTPEQLGKPAEMPLDFGWFTGEGSTFYFDRKRMMLPWYFFPYYNKRPLMATGWSNTEWNLNFSDTWDYNIAYPQQGRFESEPIFDVNAFDGMLWYYNGGAYRSYNDLFRQVPLCCTWFGVKRA